MPSSTANTTARVGCAALSLIFSTSPGFTLAGAVNVSLLVRLARLTENGTVP